MRIKELLLNILLGIGLVGIILVYMPHGTAYALSAEDIIRGTATQSSTRTGADGSVITTTYDPVTDSWTKTTKDKDGNVISTANAKPDGKGGYTETTKDSTGNVISTTWTDGKGGSATTQMDKAGNVTTTITDGKGGSTTTQKDQNGNIITTTTKTVDGRGGFVSTTIDTKTGNVTTEVKNAASGKDTITVKDKNGVVVSTTTKTPDGKGGSISVTTGNTRLKVIVTCDSAGNCTKTSSKAVSSKQKKAQNINLGTGDKSTGQPTLAVSSGKQKLQTKILNQTNQISPSESSATQKLQAEVFHQDKSNVQDTGSSGTSSGSGQQSHHKRH
jgi:hypothetical protein